MKRCRGCIPGLFRQDNDNNGKYTLLHSVLRDRQSLFFLVGARTLFNFRIHDLEHEGPFPGVGVTLLHYLEQQAMKQHYHLFTTPPCQTRAHGGVALQTQHAPGYAPCNLDGQS